MDRVSESERTIIIVILMAMAVIFTSVVLLYSNDKNIDELIDYSSDEWSVTTVTSKSVEQNNDGSLRYKVYVITHDKAPLDAFSVDKELYDQLEPNDLVTYSMIEDFVVEKFKAKK